MNKKLKLIVNITSVRNRNDCLMVQYERIEIYRKRKNVLIN